MSEDKKRGGRRLAAEDNKPEPQWTQNLALWFQNKRNRRVVIIVVIVLAIVIGAAAGLNALFQKPSVGVPNLPQPSSGVVQGEEPEKSEEEPVAHTGDRKEDFFTFLVIGRDTAGGGNTDTILLAAYDVKNQKLNVMSIPRDTMVNIPYDIKRINAVYNYNGGGDEGMDALCTEIGQLVGFMPDFHVVVEWEAVGKLVDAIGGVWFDVPVNMDYDDNTPGQDLHIHVKKGYQLLSGEDAMGVVRFRNSYVNGDLGRIEVQQDFLKAVVEQCLQIKNVTRIGELAQIFVDDVTTDLTVPNLLWFAQQAIFGGLSMDNVNFVTMPCTGKNAWSRTYQNYQSYVVPNADELVDLVNECFNPYVDDLKTNELDIMSVNKDGSLSSSTGRVEDTRATAPVSGNQSTTKPAETTPAETTPPEESTPPSEPPATSSPPSTPGTAATQPSQSPAATPTTPAESTPPSVEPTPTMPAETSPAEEPVTPPVETTPSAPAEGTEGEIPPAPPEEG